MTFKEILESIYADTGYPAAPVTGVATRFKRYVNDGHKSLLRETGMAELRRGSLPFASVADVAEYTFAQAFERIEAVVNTDSERRLHFMTRDYYRRVDPALTMTGTPDFYVPNGLQVVFRQPVSTGIWVASSAAGDTTQSVRLQGVRANGDVQPFLTAALNGTTRVQIGTLTDYRRVLNWALSATCVGNVSLYDAAAAGNELARIPIGRTAVRYETCALWHTPSAAVNYRVDGLFRITDLSNDFDEPLLPESFHDMLCTYGRKREWQRLNDGRLEEDAVEWERQRAALRNFVQFPPDYLPVMGEKTAPIAHSNLPAWFPADE